MAKAPAVKAPTIDPERAKEIAEKFRHVTGEDSILHLLGVDVMMREVADMLDPLPPEPEAPPAEETPQLTVSAVPPNA